MKGTLPPGSQLKQDVLAAHLGADPGPCGKRCGSWKVKGWSTTSPTAGPSWRRECRRVAGCVAFRSARHRAVRGRGGLRRAPQCWPSSSAWWRSWTGPRATMISSSSTTSTCCFTRRSSRARDRTRHAAVGQRAATHPDADPLSPREAIAKSVRDPRRTPCATRAIRAGSFDRPSARPSTPISSPAPGVARRRRAW